MWEAPSPKHLPRRRWRLAFSSQEAAPPSSASSRQTRQFVANVGQQLQDLGFRIIATRGTARALAKAGIEAEVVNKVTEGRPDISDRLRNDDIDLIVNTTEGRQAIADSAIIRRLALRQKVCYTTTLSGGEAFCEAMRHGPIDNVYRLQDLH